MEIFDSYRRIFYSYQVSTLRVPRGHRCESQLISNYERQWNHKHGWFKLVHVCRKWRRIVLGSPSRLDLSLVLIEHSSGNMKTVSTAPCLRSLPIRINYAWQNDPTSKDVERIAAALKQRNRVRGIVFEGQTLQLEEVFRKMRCPFPALERLEICCPCPPKLPPTFLRGSAPRLRRLKMSAIHFKSISQLLSSSTALVELSLQIDTVFGPSPTTSLVAYLQNMPCLR